MDPFNNYWVIQPSDPHSDLKDAIDFILDFNEIENVSENQNENVTENENECKWQNINAIR